jgi:putative ABC transport system ATP-binding protein
LSLLRLRGVEKSVPQGGGRAWLLRRIDLDVAPGEFVSIMGPSGCGKSTLLHMLGGLDRPTAGAVWLRGERVDGLSEKGWALLRRRHIGFVFQFFNLIGNLTVADNVELPALLMGMPARQARARRQELLADLGIEDVAHQVPGRISGGQQQRVALARALVNGPAVLLADEPTGNLDSASAREVMDVIRRYHHAGQTIVLVTHDPRVAAAADRVIHMRDGAITDESRLGGARDSASVASLVRLEV